MQTIAIVNQKGGVGKSTTAVNLGAGLVRQGKRVLLIDADSQANLTEMLGWQQPDELSPTLSTMLERIISDRPIEPQNGILHHKEGMDLLPANIELSGLEVSLVNTMSRETVLRTYLNEIKRQYDYILVDCSPSLGMLTLNALTAADRVIIPVQSHYLPVKGLEQLLRTVSNLTVSLGSGETATLTETLLPNESTTLTVWHRVGTSVTNPSYTITATGINETGTVYLDYPDIGISQMEVIVESAGKRTVRMTLYNSSAATLAGKKGREVKLAFYADDLHTKPAEVACTTNDVSVRGNEITISGDSALARIDQGTFTLDLTYDLGKYMKSIGKTEIPNVGTYLYAEAWAEGQIGGTGSNQRLPEYDGSDSEASVHMTGALARTGERLTMDVTQGNDGNGQSTAAITLRNNCLQSQTSAELVATLLDAAGTVLETKKTRIGGAISGETFRTETVTFSQLGTRVVVRAAVSGDDLLTFEGLAVGLGDFTANGTNYTYTLQNDSGATSTLVTAVSGKNEPVSINGQDLSTGGSATVAIPNSGTTDIVVKIGTKTYTLTILRNSGTGGNESGSGGATSYTLTFDTNGGSAISKVSRTSGTTVDLTGYTPTRDGYTFDGWYSNRELTIKVTSIKLTSNTTIYAKWTAKSDMSFTDVADKAYYRDAVEWAVENGITKGTTATTFSPNATCTRAQAVTFLWRTAGSPKPETRAMPFTDVPVGSYYYDAVLWAVENGITKGTSDTTFSPNMTCSRAQIVTFLWRSEKSPAAGTANPFADVKSTAYYADAVLWAVKENITKGTTSTTFSPNADCTRAQIVTFLWRCKK